jgi:hypothetical protein
MGAKPYFVYLVKGQERAVIILTTTRSSTSFLDPDTKQVYLSFLFCMAIFVLELLLRF